MTSAYTPEVAAAFHSVPVDNPKFIVDVKEYPDYPGFIFLVTYQPVINSLSMGEKMQFAEYLERLRKVVRLVVPCDLVKFDAAPPHVAEVLAARRKGGLQ